MTSLDAARILDPEGGQDAVDTLEYFAGFGGEKAELQVILTACKMGANALRYLANAEKEEVPPCINCQDVEALAKRLKCWPSYCPVCGRPLTDRHGKCYNNGSI